MAFALFFGYTGFYRLPMVTMYSIVFLIPLLITIGSVFFLSEVVRWKRFTAILIGFIGAIISINPFGAEYDNYIFLALFCPIFASASYLIVRKYGLKENLFSFLIYGKILMLVFTGVFALFIFKPVSLDHLMLNGAAGVNEGNCNNFCSKCSKTFTGAIFGSFLCTNIWWNFGGLFYFL